MSIETLEVLAPEQPKRFSQDYAAVEAEMLQVPASACLRVNLNSQKTAMRVVGALPAIRKLRPRMLKELPAFEIAQLDRLEAYAGALWHAQTLLKMVIKPPSALRALAKRAAKTRRLFLTDISLLIQRGLLEPACLKQLQGSIGYKPISADITLAVEILRAHQDRIRSHTTIKAAELDEAEQLARELAWSAGIRAKAIDEVPEAALTRQRLFTLLVRTYERVRQAVAFLSEDPRDAEEIAPSLWAGRKGKRKAAVTDDALRAENDLNAPSMGEAPVTQARANPQDTWAEAERPSPESTLPRHEQGRAAHGRQELSPGPAWQFGRPLPAVPLDARFPDSRQPGGEGRACVPLG